LSINVLGAHGEICASPSGAWHGLCSDIERNPLNRKIASANQIKNMNTNQIKAEIQARLHSLDVLAVQRSETRPKVRNRWASPLAVAAVGGTCLGTAACLPLAAPHLLPILGSALGGAGVGAIVAASTLTKAGLAICGTAISIPVSVPVSAAAALAASASAGGVWLWEILHRSASIMAVGLHGVGIGLILVATAWGAFLLLRDFVMRLYDVPMVFAV
jgi:hypothetical protein